ncbi:helix-turn-helix transcriptional regulator [Mycobacterium sp. E2733]|uniref:helix-turn-helix transcriptional regulator n=1 Tax=Mycobacterium sp. E2733 TaxID=1834138 RepID=UPI0007FCD712|nr:helix-turn-helix transcriptional regulator [Mycobacterium sp. E2733]OBH88412.1 helix-turn-helix transcriptional regulator [Mycobacterium sp. E2733]
MVTVEEFSRLVAGIYAAAVTPQQWRMAIREIHCAVGGTNGGLFSGRATSLLCSTVPMAALQSYGEYYHRLDHVLAAVEHAPVGVVQTGTKLLPLVRNTEFDTEWLRPLDIEDGLFVRLTGESSPTCFIVAAPKRTESFDTLERVKLVGSLVPHLQQALRTQHKLSALADRSVGMAGALEVVRHGVIIVAGDHLVVNLNSAAERILRNEDGLCMQSGRIAATSSGVERELNVAIRNALADDCSIVRTSQSLTCVRPSSRRPYVIHVLPSYHRDADEPRRQPMALVLVIDPEDEPEPPSALLRRLYHLTQAEAEIALRVLHGADLREISEELSVSLPTVRTHLQHVFDKTNTHRQADLVRLLLVLSP